MASEIEVNWRIGKSLHQRLQYILEGQCSTDVTFIVGAKGNQKRIQANRFMLSCGSQVFEAMFQEASEDQVLVVDDVDPDTFMEILKFVYYEQAMITGANALYVLKAAKKFDLPQLVEKCFSFFEKSMNPQIVCGILNSSLGLDEHDVTDSCMTYIRNTTEAVLISEPFTSLSAAALMRIVEDGSMTCDSEYQVYQACMRWAEAECGRRGLTVTDGNKRDVLGVVLYQIRFYQLNGTLFSHLMRNSFLLNAEEKLEIYDMIADRDHGVDQHGTYRFNTTARPGPNPKKSQLTVERFGNISRGWGCDGTSDAIDFTSPNPTKSQTFKRFEDDPEAEFGGRKEWSYDGRSDAFDFRSNKPLLVIGAGLYGGEEAGTHEVHMQLLDDKDGVLADTGNITMTSDGTTTPIPVLFPTPCLVDADRTYCMRATIKGGKTYCGTHGEVGVTSGQCTLSFSKCRHSSRSQPITMTAAGRRSQPITMTAAGRRSQPITMTAAGRRSQPITYKKRSSSRRTDVDQGQIPTIIVSLF